ncbi:hypothetical protein GQX74_012617 [Glossina fuscipes]|nr:hypothetical protein GQX74_012617 [Glossina fuscipes]
MYGANETTTTTTITTTNKMTVENIYIVKQEFVCAIGSSRCSYMMLVNLPNLAFRASDTDVPVLSRVKGQYERGDFGAYKLHIYYSCWHYVVYFKSL